MKKYFLSAIAMICLLPASNVMSNFDVAWHAVQQTHAWNMAWNRMTTVWHMTPSVVHDVFNPQHLMSQNMTMPQAPMITHFMPPASVTPPDFGIHMTSNMYVGGMILVVLMTNLLRILS